MQQTEPMSVRLLYGRHKDETIYIVGSGSSMRVFPSDFLADKVTIGLNMAWKNVPVNYGITIHPDLNIPEFVDGEESRPEITWITTLDRCELLLDTKQHAQTLARFYFFQYLGQANTSSHSEPGNSGRILDWVKRPTEDYLYLWSSISQTAVNLAANMGAKYIVLVGCDNCGLLDNHHAHKQHTAWKGVHPNVRYRQYYEGMAEVRSALSERGIKLVSLTPFLGLNVYEEDFVRLCKELNQEILVGGKDISPPPTPYWIRVFRGTIFHFCLKLGVVEEMRTVKRWLKLK